MTNDQIELTVRYHPSGRYTLMQKVGRDTTDVCISDDKGDFYQMVSHKLCELANQGIAFSFTDSASN